MRKMEVKFQELYATSLVETALAIMLNVIRFISNKSAIKHTPNYIWNIFSTS